VAVIGLGLVRALSAGYVEPAQPIDSKAKIMLESAAASILIVDDDETVRRVLVDSLKPEGFAVYEAASGAAMQGVLADHAIDLITLDLNLAGEDGLKLAREVRARRNIPIIMITGKSDPIDRVVGLELGADDYIPKPFHMREVLARIRAVLRRYQPAIKPPASAAPGPGRGIYVFEGRRLDLGRREFTSASGAVVDLTTTEFDLLAIFLAAPGRVLSRDQIMDQLKGHDWSPLDRSIDSMVARLRRKIEPENETPKLIKTVRGVGYAFAGSVTST
jgi:DNA-binding response OmpR family regulator